MKLRLRHPLMPWLYAWDGGSVRPIKYYMRLDKRKDVLDTEPYNLIRHLDLFQNTRTVGKKLMRPWVN